jgi:type IV secretion system protein VirB10
MSSKLSSNAPVAAMGLGRRQIVLLAAVGLLGMGGSAGLAFRMARSRGPIPVSPVSVDEARLAAKVEERRARAAADARKLHQQELGQGYQFDAQGNLLGPAADGANLPRNKSFAEESPPNREAAAAAEIRRGIAPSSGPTWGDSADSGDREAEGGGEPTRGRSGARRPGAYQRDDSVGGDARDGEAAAADRAALGAPMLGYSTVDGANWATRRPEKSGGGGGVSTAPRAKTKQSVEEHQSEAMDRLVKTVEESARALGPVAEASRARPASAGIGVGPPGGDGPTQESPAPFGRPTAVSPGPSTAGDALYGANTTAPAEREPRLFESGGVGDMRIGGDLGPDETVRQGKFLDCVLVNELRADLVDSPVIAMVSRDFVGLDGRYVLVPAGAKLLGEAGRIQNLQQERVYIKFDRLLFPDQRSAYFPVRKVSGVDSMGAVGVAGDVDRHFLLQFGAAVVLGVLDGVGAAVQSPSAGTNPTLRDLVMARASGNFSTVIGGVIQKYANVVPTVTVAAGAKMKVFFAEDVRLSPYLRTRELRWARGAR